MKSVTVNIIWKILYSRWIRVRELELSVLQYKLSVIYFTAGGR